MSLENEPEPVGRYSSVAEAFEKNPWMFNFVSALCDLYGVPSTASECSSPRERMLYAWAAASCISAIERYRVLWIGGFEQYDVKLSAVNFAEAYIELAGEHVIPPLREEFFQTKRAATA